MIHVRPGELADLEVLVRFNAAMARETEQLELDLERLRAGVRAVLEGRDAGARGSYRVALDGERAVGALMGTTEWSDWRDGWFWWIQSVFVVPESRRRGVLSALYRGVLEEARSRDDVCGVRLYVERENLRARDAYRRLGMADSSYRLMEVDLVLERPSEPTSGQR